MPHFATDPGVTVFASGVSNSRETRAEAFARERALLREALADDRAHQRLTLYFSTCSIHDVELESSPYVTHKIAMENLVRDSARFAIFRLPQVVGATPNPNTLTNYLNRQIRSGTPFQIWKHASRNLIDVADVAAIVADLVRTHQADHVVTNIACPFSIPVVQLVEIFEHTLDRRAQYETLDAGGHYFIDASLALVVAERIGIRFDDQYIRNLIRKYYA